MNKTTKNKNKKQKNKNKKQKNKNKKQKTKTKNNFFYFHKFKIYLAIRNMSYFFYFSND